MKNIAVARRYAGALYEEALDANIVDAVMADLSQFSSLITHSPEFSALVSSPTISIKDKLGVIDKLTQSGKMNKLVMAFLTVLTRNRRLAILPDVIEAFNERTMNARNEIKVKVAYATPVDDSIRKSLKERLAKMTGKNIILAESVEPKLLGGMRIVVGSSLYDMSIKGKLDAMKHKYAKK